MTTQMPVYPQSTLKKEDRRSKGVIRVFRSLRLGCSFVGLVLTLAACGGSSSTPTPTNTPVHTGSNGGTNTGSTVYAPVEISVSFEGGSTTPTTIKTSTPKQFDGTLARPRISPLGWAAKPIRTSGRLPTSTPLNRTAPIRRICFTARLRAPTLTV
jgi:hypothetical protein